MDGLPGGQTSFTLHAASDTLPTPLNLKPGGTLQILDVIYVGQHFQLSCTSLMAALFDWTTTVSSNRDDPSKEAKLYPDLRGYGASDNPLVTALPKEAKLYTDLRGYGASDNPLVTALPKEAKLYTDLRGYGASDNPLVTALPKEAKLYTDLRG